MKPAIILTLLFAVLISACQSGSDKTAVNESKETSQCYVYISSKDTVSLNLVLNGDTVNGVLSYKFYEKDANRGTISGSFKGDTLVADYTFNSEGTESVRQVVFLKTATGFQEGFGEAVDVSGKSVFRDIKTLKFSEGLKLLKTDCLQ